MKLFFSHSNYDNAAASDNFGVPSVQDYLARTISELENAYLRLDFVTNPDLIECYIYEVNSLLKRCKYLKEKAGLLETTP